MCDTHRYKFEAGSVHARGKLVERVVVVGRVLANILVLVREMVAQVKQIGKAVVERDARNKVGLRHDAIAWSFLPTVALWSRALAAICR